MSAPRVIVLAGLGINCERETAAAFRMAGANADILHINALCSDAARLHDAAVLAFPGGFSFGDHLGAGQALANRIRHRTLADGRTLLAHIASFVENGGYVLGVCNGFQVLTKLGLVPNIGGTCTQEVALAHNASGRFENRWCRLLPSSEGPAAPFGALGAIELPSRHGEGRVVFRDAEIRQEVIARSLNWLTYAEADGCAATEFPGNPNGADLACAGLTDVSGRVLGLMPHPEAFVSLYTHYDWSGRLRTKPGTPDVGDGLHVMRILVREASGGEKASPIAAKEEL